jgi:hypothetical protein
MLNNGNAETIPASKISMIDRKCKLVFAIRNPKDVAVSHYHHVRGLIPLYNYHGSWDNFLDLFIKGNGN